MIVISTIDDSIDDGGACVDDVVELTRNLPKFNFQSLNFKGPRGDLPLIHY